MKKLLALLLAMAMLFALTACGEKPEEEPVDNDYVYDDSFDAVESDGTTTTTTEPADEPAAWKEFLQEYEEWVDSYIDIVQKYKNNPTDMSILSDYTAMAADVSEWASRADDMEGELDDPTEIAEYTAELARIVAKLTEAMY